MRILGQNVEYTFTVIDKQSRDEQDNPTKLTFLYRLPTTSERQQYLNALDPRDKNDDDGYYLTRVRFASDLITGIGEGCFGRMASNGQPVPISSDEKSEHYYEGWREAIATSAGDVLAKLAVTIFDKPFLDSTEKN